MSIKRLNKRSLNGQPVDLYVELTLVTDYDNILKHKAILNTNDDVLCMAYMKIYYSHIINSVCVKAETVFN